MRSLSRCLAIALVAQGALAPAPLTAMEPLLLVPQQGSYWCWAASAQMVLLAYGQSLQASRHYCMAGRLYPPLDDCSSTACNPGGGTARSCNYPGFPQFRKFGYSVEIAPAAKPLSPRELSRELSCRPVIFADENLVDGRRAGSGHMVVLGSSSTAKGRLQLEVFDPGGLCFGGRRFIDYSDYAGTGSRAHWVTYYGIRPADRPFQLCDASGTELPEKSDALESDSSLAVLGEFLAAASKNPWSRRASGLGGDGALSCVDPVILSQYSIPIEALRAASPQAPLTTLARPLERRRYLCGDGAHVYSVELQREASGRWRPASLGDQALAERMLEGVAKFSSGVEPMELSIEGLGLRYLWVRSGPNDWLIAVDSNPAAGLVPPASLAPNLLPSLIAGARQFLRVGPS